jgi:hypothetical protein
MAFNDKKGNGFIFKNISKLSLPPFSGFKKIKMKKKNPRKNHKQFTSIFPLSTQSQQRDDTSAKNVEGLGVKTRRV